MNSVLGIGEKIVFINKGHCDWIGNDKTIFRSKSQSLNDFVFASKLFQEVKKFLEREYEAEENI
ncbi:MAG: ABC transporter ATP-binding protein, partial [Muribaculaceae bacterium]|nr:ABC transporter ATP-binding protein [Muribaculaceae bacterium]